MIPIYKCSSIYKFLIPIQLKTLHYHTGDDRPDMRDLDRYIVEQQVLQWEGLGVQLLGEKLLGDLEYYCFAKHNPNRSVCYFRKILEKWLEIDPSATWGKLDDAIKNIYRRGY